MRFHPHTNADRSAMLAKIGVDSVDALYSAVPADCPQGTKLNLPSGKTEAECGKIFEAFANDNHAASDGPFFLGAGCYFHHVPATVDYIIQRSEFLTSYTPYQPEVSQGTLQVVFEYQSIIAALTGQEIANASMYDGATALAEAALMAKRVTGRANVIVNGSKEGNLHPHYTQVLATYLKHIGGEIAETADENCAAIIVQYPDFHGEVTDLQAARAQADAAGAQLIVVVNEIVALGLLPAPSQADIVVGEAQSIGNAMMFGGPHLGFLACAKKNVRSMPGRICGATVDADGKRAFVLTLSTREQHIRREKATSNICTNQGLCATAFTTHMALLGEIGFKKLALLNHSKAQQLAAKLEAAGLKLLNKTYFNEFVIEVKNVTQVVEKAAENKIIAGLAIAENKLLVCATEMTSEDDMDKLAKILK
jgi:glycine dehydrogenase subunit 1